jgi:Lipocalin-like domain
MAPAAELAGTWHLVSWCIEVLESGEQLHQFGDKPPGYIHFTLDGRVFAVLTASDRKPVETEFDQIAAFGSLIAYTGRYRVEGSRLVTKVDVSADPAAVGTELVRFYKLTGNRLEITTAPFFSNKPSVSFGGRQLRSQLLWRRGER